MISRPAPDDRIPRLTRVAVDRVAAVAGRVDAEVLQGLLYRAGSVAVGPRTGRVWDPAWLAHVVASQAARVPDLAAAYTARSTAHWHAWNRNSLVPAHGDAPVRPCHKVYVSPRPEHLIEALPTVFALAADASAAGLKVGASTEGALRPDKIVVYSESAENADRLAQQLADALTELAPQGVPFTGQVGSTGIVSRGTDPAGTSWRAWLIAEVASALRDAATTGAERDGTGRAVADRALARLSMRGIDVDTWWPVPDLAELAA